MNLSNSLVSCFGKLPNFGDFVRYGAGGPEIRKFEEWLQEGLYLAQKEFDKNWDSAYRHSPSYHFLFYHRKTERFLLGIIQLSRDRSERKYPFIVALKIDKNTFHEKLVPFVPLIFSDFFSQTHQFLKRALQGLELRDLVAQLKNLSPSIMTNLESYHRSFVTYLENTTLETFWNNILGQYGDPRKFLIVKNLTEILEPLRNQSLERMSLGLRFPLGMEIAMMNQVVCFWIHISLQLLGNPAIIPNFFWNLPEAGEKNYLFLFFTTPSSKTFLQLIQPELENDSICQLDEEGKDKLSDSARDISFQYSSELQTKELTLNDFLSKL